MDNYDFPIENAPKPAQNHLQTIPNAAPAREVGPAPARVVGKVEKVGKVGKVEKVEEG